MKLPKWKWWQWTLAIFGGLILLGALGRCINPEAEKSAVVAAPTSTATPSDPIADMKRRNRDWRNVSLTSGVLHFEADVDGFYDAARDIQKVGTWLSEHPEVLVQSVEYAPSISVIDRLGNERQVGLMVTAFSATDLRSAKFNNLTAGSTLGLATSARPSSPAGLQTAAEWCSDRDNVAFTGAAFCSKILA